MPANGNGAFDVAGWRLMLAGKLGEIGGHDCLRCMTPHGAIDVTARDLLHWYIATDNPAELIALNYLVSNARPMV